MDDQGYNSEDLAWAAGLFEGEGSFKFLTDSKTGRRKYIGLRIMMSDQDVVERFKAILEANTSAIGARGARSHIWLPKKEAEHHKQLYGWEITGHRGEAAYKLLRPHLGQRRRARGDEIMAAVEGARIAISAETRVCPECGRVFQLGASSWAKRFCSRPCVEKFGSRKRSISTVLGQLEIK